MLFSRRSHALAWGPTKGTWTDHLIEEIYSREWSPLIISPCVTLTMKDCLAHTLSIIAKKESGLNPRSIYIERNLKLSKGLFQLSAESVNQKAYDCKVSNRDLLNPYTNIGCAVKIAHFWLNRDLVFFTESQAKDRNLQKGLSRYWTVARPSSL